VELLPEKRLLRVRGVETAGTAVERAEAGQRTAVNLAGIEPTAIRRGMLLANPGKFSKTRRVDARLELLASAPRMKNRTRVHFHSGTAECIAEVLLYDRTELLPGQSSLVQLRLADDVVVVRGDRFIARQFSPVTTIGGGRVLDPLARRPTPKDRGRGPFLATLEQGSREEILGALAERNSLGLGLPDIVARTGWLEAEVLGACRRLGSAGTIRVVSEEPLLLLPERMFEEITKKLLVRLEAFHKENPLSPGMSREELRVSAGRRVRAETFRAALEELARQKKLVTVGELVNTPGRAITLTPEEAQAKEQIARAFAKAGLAVPSVKEVLSQLAMDSRRAEKILQILLREKVLVRVSPELIFHEQALGRLPELLQSYKRSRGERIGVPAFKELTGITRKYAIPLLEHLDRQRLTRRVGDERVIL